MSSQSLIVIFLFLLVFLGGVVHARLFLRLVAAYLRKTRHQWFLSCSHLVVAVVCGDLHPASGFFTPCFLPASFPAPRSLPSVSSCLSACRPATGRLVSSPGIFPIQFSINVPTPVLLRGLVPAGVSHTR